jgi:eukaryotic-like serine/threonine-protein kinase
MLQGEQTVGELNGRIVFDTGDTRVLREGRFGSRYQIVRKLATGGMGEIFVARDATGDTETRIALKVLLPHLSEEPTFLHMFLDEARTVARLEHPNILSVFDVGTWNGRLFMAMPLVDGVSVGALIHACTRQSVQVPTGVLRFIAKSLCDALDHAHSLCAPDGTPDGIVHRDVSPPNVLLSRDGQVLLTDFGVAKAASNVHRTQPGSMLGKIAYMPPEQIENCSDVDHRCDLYSAAVTLFELATGTSPYARDNDASTLMAVLRGSCPDADSLRPDLSRSFVRALKRSLSPQAAARHPSARAFCEDLMGGEELASPSELAEFLRQVCPSDEVPSTAASAPPRTATLHGALARTATPKPAPRISLTALGPVATDIRVSVPNDGPWSGPTVINEGPTGVQPHTKRSRRWLRPALVAVAGTAFAVFTGFTLFRIATFHRAPPERPNVAKSVRSSPSPSPVPPTLTQVRVAEPILAMDLRAELATVATAREAPEPKRARRVAPPPKPRPPSPGFVSLDASPWAIVTIDGKRLDETPIVRHALSPGEHILMFENPELKKRTRRKVVVQEGKLQVVRVSLE